RTAPAEIESPGAAAKTEQPKSHRRQRQRKLVPSIVRQPVLKMHLPNGHAHLDHEGEREEARKQSQYDGDSAEEFRPRGKICQPARKAERAHHVHVMMKPAEHLVIAMRDHDRAQNEPHHEQRQGMQPVEEIHGYLQRAALSSQLSALSSQLSALRKRLRPHTNRRSIVREMLPQKCGRCSRKNLVTQNEEIFLRPET